LSAHNFSDKDKSKAMARLLFVCFLVVISALALVVNASVPCLQAGGVCVETIISAVDSAVKIGNAAHQATPLFIDQLMTWTENAKQLFQFQPRWKAQSPGSDVETDYDIVFEFKDVDSLVEHGFDVTVSQRVIDELQKQDPNANSWVVLNHKYFKGGMLVVVGKFNGGKTWFFNRLANVNLKSGVDQTTVGFSFKLIDSIPEFPLWLVDSLGHDNPTKQSTVEAIAKRRVQEATIKQVARDIADVRIMVVNQITSSDQLEVIALAEELKTTNTFRYQTDGGIEGQDDLFFVLVHNVRMDVKDFNKYFTAHIDESFPDRICTKLIHDTSMKNVLKSDYAPLCDGFAAGEFIMESNLLETKILHYFMLEETADGSNKSERIVNDIMLEDLLTRIRTKVDMRKFNKPRPVLGRALQSMEQALDSFMDCDRSNQNNVCSSKGLEFRLNTYETNEASNALTTGAAGVPVNALHVSLDAKYVVRHDIAANIVQKPLSPQAPDVPMTVYEASQNETKYNKVVKKHTEKEVHTHTILDLELASLNAESDIDVTLQPGNRLELMFHKPIARLNWLGSDSKNKLQLRYNNRKSGRFSRVYFLPSSMSASDDSIEICVEDGILRIIINNVNIKADEWMNCDKLKDLQELQKNSTMFLLTEEEQRACGEAAANETATVPDHCVVNTTNASYSSEDYYLTSTTKESAVWHYMQKFNELLMGKK
jgi:HSP20 family molecular chaperone IbpA